MRYAVVIENAGSNFSASVPDLPGCVATGATLADPWKLPPDTSLERDQTLINRTLRRVFDSAPGSDSYARRITCTRSEFSSTQMR